SSPASHLPSPQGGGFLHAPQSLGHDPQLSPPSHSPLPQHGPWQSAGHLHASSPAAHLPSPQGGGILQSPQSSGQIVHDSPGSHLPFPQSFGMRVVVVSIVSLLAQLAAAKPITTRTKRRQTRPRIH